MPDYIAIEVREHVIKMLRQILTDTLANISQNVFAHSFVLEHSKHLFYFKKKIAFLAAGGGVDGGGGEIFRDLAILEL